MENTVPIELSPKAKKIVIIGNCCMALSTWLIMFSITIALPKIFAYYDMVKQQPTIITIGSAIMAFSSILGGRISDSLGRKRYAIAISIIRFAIEILCIVKINGAVFTALYFILQMLNGLIGSTHFAIVNDICTPSEKPKIVGLLGTFNAISLILGIFLGGVIVDLFGGFNLFWFLLPFNIPTIVLFSIYFKNKKGTAKTPLLPFNLLKNRNFLFAFIFTFMVTGMVYLSSTGITMFGTYAINKAPSIVGTLALPKNILFIFIPGFLGTWMSKDLKNYGKTVYIAGISIFMGSLACAFLTTGSPLIAIYGAMAFFGVSTSCQLVFTHSYYPFFVPQEQIGGAAAMINFSGSIGPTCFGAIYTFVYNRNYDAFTADGGQGIASLVEKSFRAPAIASAVAALIIIVMRYLFYNGPSIQKEKV